MALQAENYVPALKYGAAVNTSDDLALASGKILVGGTDGLSDAVTMSGDATISSAGVFSLAAPEKSSYVQATLETAIATTGAATIYLMAPAAGTLQGAVFSATSALATSDTNYLTFTLVNLGQAGAGTTAMLAVSAANTTQVTGGTALDANGGFTLTLHGTPANLAVAQNDRIKLVATATGTLAGTVTFPSIGLDIART